MRTLIIACAFAAAAATPTFADSGDIEIRIARNDLSSPVAVAALHAKIERAARRVCDLRNRLSPIPYTTRLRCVRDTVDDTVRAANKPALTDLHVSLTSPTRS